MKHLAIRARSLLNLNKPYTTPGLGDRIHTIYFSYLYAVANNTPVTIHLDSWKYGKPHKLASWKEVLELFPKDIVNIQYHEIITPTDQQWLDFL
ncbi:hypothetical protein EB155_07900, partial [archaeon]|nr:hypothetical protein [archaeon]